MKKIIIFLIIILLSLNCITSAMIQEKEKINLGKADLDEKEYWALIIGMGEYAYRPDQELSSDKDVTKMVGCLVYNGFWERDHIKTITGKNATKLNIIKAFNWLDSKEDNNDIVVVYFSTHGKQLSFFNIPIDIPPFDEADHCDEVLITYYGFINPLVNLRDDELNIYLNKLESESICVIVESCYSGGFNDLSKFNTGTNSFLSFNKDFKNDISEKGRIILMASKEDEVSWSIGNLGSYFTESITGSISLGLGDFNKDSYVSAEEAFVCASMDLLPQHPTLSDNYDGEFKLSKSRFNIDYFNNFEKDIDNWITTDHTNGIGNNLWHNSVVDYKSFNRCWYLGNENSLKYNNNMNNSLSSPVLKLGNNPRLKFNVYAEKEINDSLFFEVTTDNWTTYKSLKLYPEDSDICSTKLIFLYKGYFGDLSNKDIKIRFRFESDKKVPFNPDPDFGEIRGFVIIDDLIIYSEL